MKHYKYIVIDEQQIRKIIEMGLIHNPNPWKSYGNTIDEMIDTVVDRLYLTVQQQSINSLHSGLTYQFPSTVVLYTKMFDQRTRTYSDTVVECTLMYTPPTELHNRQVYPNTDQHTVHPNGNYETVM